jgi:hypothetical protein
MDECEDFEEILPLIYPEKEDISLIKEQFFQFLSNEVS